MKAVVAAFNQEKALVGAFSVITNLRMEFFEALVVGVNNPDERDYGRFRILNVGREIYLSGDGGCGLLLGEHF